MEQKTIVYQSVIKTMELYTRSYKGTLTLYDDTSMVAVFPTNPQKDITFKVTDVAKVWVNSETYFHLKNGKRLGYYVGTPGPNEYSNVAIAPGFGFVFIPKSWRAGGGSMKCAREWTEVLSSYLPPEAIDPPISNKAATKIFIFVFIAAAIAIYVFLFSGLIG